jgi:nucleotide-binding universal stress UspA family protein
VPKRPRRIVIATDFSPGSAAALEAALAFYVPEGGTRTHLVHVVEPTAFAPPPPLWVDYDRARVEDARARLDREAKRFHGRLDATAKTEAVLLTGAPHVEICRLADHVGADLIVVGTHGRTGVRHAVIGSVAERVVRHAGRPVLTIPLRRAKRRPARRA